MKSKGLCALILTIVLSASFAEASHHNNNRKVADASWTPAVGDDAKYYIYEEQPTGDGVLTGTLEKQIIQIQDGTVTIQSLLTTRTYDGKTNQSTKTLKVAAFELASGAIMVRDCAQPTTIPVSIQTDAGTFNTCMMTPDPGTDLDGDPAIFNTFLGLVPFGTVRQDSVKVGNHNHIRITLLQTILGKAVQPAQPQ